MGHVSRKWPKSLAIGIHTDVMGAFKTNGFRENDHIGHIHWHFLLEMAILVDAKERVHRLPSMHAMCGRYHPPEIGTQTLVVTFAPSNRPNES